MKKMPSGYLRAPLIKKLGIKENYRVRFIQTPEDYLEIYKKW